MNNEQTYKYYLNGTIQSQSWYENGKFHRLNELPAYISYHEDGSIRYQAWWENGKFHRPNGLPARIWYYKDGAIQYQEWFENGIQLSDKQVLQRKQQRLNKIINIINKKGDNYYDIKKYL